MTAPLCDPMLIDDWHPVAIAAELAPGQQTATLLLDTHVLVWRSQDGRLHTWEDRCPHRGMKLSMGSLQSDGVTCPYHGWIFGEDGQCKHIPAMPELTPERMTGRVTTYAVQERYGLVWVCLGTPAQDVLPFPEFADARLRKVWCGPYEVAASGPRLVENFLDMSHFAWVHTDILGEKTRPEIPDYEVQSFDDPVYGSGVRAVQCQAWQPRANKLSDSGSLVAYSYRVVRPLTAILTKEPEAMAGFHEAISLHLQPMTETRTRAWIILAMTNFESSDAELRQFQDTIFLQDQPIVENQSPLRLPLVPGMEMSIPVDRMSLAYRRYLKQLGLRYGVVSEAG